MTVQGTQRPEPPAQPTSPDARSLPRMRVKEGAVSKTRLGHRPQPRLGGSHLLHQEDGPAGCRLPATLTLGQCGPPGSPRRPRRRSWQTQGGSDLTSPPSVLWGLSHQSRAMALTQAPHPLPQGAAMCMSITQATALSLREEHRFRHLMGRTHFLQGPGVPAALHQAL